MTAAAAPSFIQHPVNVELDKSIEQARMRLEAIRIDLQREHGITLIFSHMERDARTGIHVAHFRRVIDVARAI